MCWDWDLETGGSDCCASLSNRDQKEELVPLRNKLERAAGRLGGHSSQLFQFSQPCSGQILIPGGLGEQRLGSVAFLTRLWGKERWTVAKGGIFSVLHRVDDLYPSYTH